MSVVSLTSDFPDEVSAGVDVVVTYAFANVRTHNATGSRSGRSVELRDHVGIVAITAPAGGWRWPPDDSFTGLDYVFEPSQEERRMGLYMAQPSGTFTVTYRFDTPAEALRFTSTQNPSNAPGVEQTSGFWEHYLDVTEPFVPPVLPIPAPREDYLWEIGFPRDFGGWNMPTPLPSPQPLVFTRGPELGADRRSWIFSLATGQPNLQWCVWTKSSSGFINEYATGNAPGSSALDVESFIDTSFPHVWVYAITATDQPDLLETEAYDTPESPEWTLRWYAPEEPPAYAEVVIADAPTVWWRMNDTGLQTTDLADSSGNGHEGSSFGTLTRGGDNGLLVRTADSAIYFSGDDFVNLAWGTDGEWMDAMTSYTLEALIKRAASSDWGIIWERDSDINGPRLFQFRVTPDGNLEFIWFDAGGSLDSVLSPQMIAVDQRAHVAATLEVVGATTAVRLFVDGELVAQADVAYAARTSAPGVSIKMGEHRLSGAPYHRYVGTIDEAAIYDYALHPDRIAIHAQAAFTRAYPPIIETDPNPPVVLPPTVWTSQNPSAFEESSTALARSSGGYSTRIYTASGETTATWRRSIAGAVAGRTYRFTLYARLLTAGKAAEVFLGWQAFKSGGDLQGSLANAVPGTGDWSMLQGAFVMPATYTSLDMTLSAYTSNGQTVEVFLDDDDFEDLGVGDAGFGLAPFGTSPFGGTT